MLIKVKKITALLQRSRYASAPQAMIKMGETRSEEMYQSLLLKVSKERESNNRNFYPYTNK